MTRVGLFSIVLASFFVAACSSSTASLAPIDWQRVPGSGPNGSILGFGPSGSFDEAGNFTISAFRDTDGTYRLYYGGADTATIDPKCTGINGVHWRIGLATSTDGVNFTRVLGSQPKGSILDNGNTFDTF